VSALFGLLLLLGLTGNFDWKLEGINAPIGLGGQGIQIRNTLFFSNGETDCGISINVSNPIIEAPVDKISPELDRSGRLWN
jgi:hypothetical protein